MRLTQLSRSYIAIIRVLRPYHVQSPVFLSFPKLEVELIRILMVTWKCCKLEYARVLIDNVSECENGESSSNLNLVLYTHLHVNNPGNSIKSNIASPISELITKNTTRKKILSLTDINILQYQISS